MKNQYVGDIGDYGKYALLRALSCRYSVGVNWYLTPDDGRSDGKFTDYLKRETDSFDKSLFKMLKGLLLSTDNRILNEKRNVQTIEDGGILPKTVFFSEELSYEKIADREVYRKNWVNRSIDTLEKRDIIFLDPDNGLEVKSVSATSKNGNKYVTYDEAQQYYKQAQVALIIYNHRDRSSEEKYVERFLRFYEEAGTQDAFVYRLMFRKSSVRDYIFITKPEHSTEIYDFLNTFACPERKEYFTVDNLPMRWLSDDN